MPTLDRNDGKYEIRIQGLPRMKKGMTQQLEGLVMSMRETDVYSDEDRFIMAKYLSAEAAAILERLNPGVQREYEIKFEKLRRDESNADIRNLLLNLKDSN